MLLNITKNNPKAKSESWYITPIGNPSGTKMEPNQMIETLEEILKHNKDAVIILDIVYARTLLESNCKELFAGFQNKTSLFQNIIFVESFSKSHGLCRERLGLYFSANETLFTKLHSGNIAFSAGPGDFKDFQFRALGEMSEVDRKGVEDLHVFWKHERKGLYNYLMKPEFSDLFDQKQAHITPQDMENPCTLYILLKCNKGVTAQDIFIKTGALGVDTPFHSGHYVRFAVGQLVKPTYQKYATKKVENWKKQF